MVKPIEKQGQDMNELTARKTDIQTALNDQLKKMIVNNTEIKNAILQNPDYVKRLLQENIIDELKADIAHKKTIMCYDFQQEATDFLKQCELRSKHTAKAYKYALADFTNWTESKDIETPLAITPELADAYIYDLQMQGKAAATIRQHIGGLSAFYNGMERKSNFTIKNCFRGTRALPKKKAVKRIENEIPTENLKLFRKDINTIIKNESCNELKTMIYLMAFRGLRAGSFQKMSIHGKKFFTESKGKEISGELPAICIEAIEKACLKKTAPFVSWNTAKVSSMFQYHIGKLYKVGKIAYKYSAHDLRHFYALAEYTKNKDIYALKNLLNHSSIAVTEIYLQGLGVDLKND